MSSFVIVKPFCWEETTLGRDYFIDVNCLDRSDCTVLVRFKYNPWFIIRSWTRQDCDKILSSLYGDMYPSSIVGSLSLDLRDSEQAKPEETLLPSVKIVFGGKKSHDYARSLLCKGKHIVGESVWYRYKNVEIQVEFDVSQFVRYQVENKLRTTEWLNITCDERAKWGGLGTRFDKELSVPLSCVSRAKDQMNLGITNVKVLSFDLEQYSKKHVSMPDVNSPSDEIYIISCALGGRDGSTVLYVFTHIRNSYEVKDGEKLVVTKDERDTMMKFFDLIRDFDPDVVIGHNIFRWDNPYLDGRLGYYGERFPDCSRYIGEQVVTEHSKWDSSAYKDVDIYKIVTRGRIWMDTAQYIQRRFPKEDLYNLKYVSNKFLKIHKIDLSPQEQFRLYEAKTIEPTIAYAFRDAILPLELFRKLDCWICLCSAADSRRISIFDTYGRGQGIAVFGQEYYNLYWDKYFAAPVTISKSAQFEGAYVVPTVPGIHEYVIMMDVVGMYPTMIIEYNLCFTTLVKDPEVPDSCCNVFEWIDGKTGKRVKYRFILPSIREGIIPKFLKVNRQERIDAKAIRDTFKKGSLMWRIWDRVQEDIKTTMNSCFGDKGSPMSKRPCLALANVTTYKGRVSLIKMIDYVTTKYKGVVIMGDTDSTAFTIPHLPALISKYNAKKIFNKMAEDISSIFDVRIEVGFEKMWRILLSLTKKTYCGFHADLSRVCDIPWDDNNLFQAKGVCLVKRDNFPLVKRMFKEAVLAGFAGRSLVDTVRDVLGELYDCDLTSLTLVTRIGSNYKDENCANCKFIKHLYANFQSVAPGDRLEYVYIKPRFGATTIGPMGGINLAKVGDSMESLALYERNEALMLDYTLYINRLRKKLLPVCTLIAPKELASMEELFKSEIVKVVTGGLSRR